MPSSQRMAHRPRFAHTFQKAVVTLALLTLALLAGFTSSSLVAQIPPTRIDNSPGHPRAVIISDIGNEPDDQMSFVRLLLYSNEIDLEAMIAATSTWQRTATHPETMHTLVQAYAEVRPNLLLHAQGWPTAQHLDQNIFAGQPVYGLAATGPDKLSAGAKAIIRAADLPDQRPLWISIWGGANTLAQALLTVRQTRTPEELAAFVQKLRVYSISDQDDAGPWIRREFPTLFYIVQPSTPTGDDYFYATWTGISGSRFYRNNPGADPTKVTNEWLDTNIRAHGPLGKLYPRFAYIMEGDTPAFLNLIDNGLNGFRRPDWGGWGGRYVFRQPYGETHPIWTQGGDSGSHLTSRDTVTGIDGHLYTSDQATIWRWRDAYQNDFAARMAWTVADFAHGNHNPLVTVNRQPGTTPIQIEAHFNQPILLDASASQDPDPNQHLHFTWFPYPEAGGTGATPATVTLTNADTPTATATATCPPQAAPNPCTATAHIILAVTDDGFPSLTTYRRIILTLHP